MGEALGNAVDAFKVEDTAAGEVMDGLRTDMEGGDERDDEWTADSPDYDSPKVDDPRDAAKD